MDVYRGAYALLLVASLGACGGDDKGPVVLGPLSDAAPKNPINTDSDAGVIVATTGPIVTLQSPLASNDPVAGPVLTGASVDVKCQAKQRTGEDPVDPTKVSIAVFGSASAEPLLIVPAVLQGTDLYGASVALGTVPSGRVRIRCSATDTATTAPIVGASEVQTYFDAGPVITFTNLNDTSIIARGTDDKVDMSVQFKVEPSKLSDTDTGADVDIVKLSISERDVSLAAPVDHAYTKEIDFYSFFDKAPVASVTIAVTATNKRSGKAAVATKQFIVRVDGQGPAVAITSPQQSGGRAPIVGGTVAMTMTITDELSGVAEGADKLFALMPGMSKTYPLVAGANNSYSFTFEASQFVGTAKIVPQIHAFDKAGNESIASILLLLDTVPPWVSLDPANVRAIASTGAPPQCSASFDPLGESPVDGQVILQEARFRAFVWERGIKVEGAEDQWIAGVRNDSVAFYAQTDPNTPLLINRSGNTSGSCDAINSKPLTNPNFVTALSPVSVGGAPPKTPTEGPGSFTYPPVVQPSACALVTADAQPRCQNSELSYVVGHTMAGRPPVVYADSPTSSDVGCTGISTDLGTKGGWTCVAVAARDLAGAQGNLAISKPLRVCRKLKDSDCEGRPSGALLPPPASLTCTDGCTLPDEWITQPTESYFPTY